MTAEQLWVRLRSWPPTVHSGLAGPAPTQVEGICGTWRRLCNRLMKDSAVLRHFCIHISVDDHNCSPSGAVKEVLDTSSSWYVGVGSAQLATQGACVASRLFVAFVCSAVITSSVMGKSRKKGNQVLSDISAGSNSAMSRVNTPLRTGSCMPLGRNTSPVFSDLSHLTYSHKSTGHCCSSSV